jgi:sulfoxide reductase catalytic subunit YedY
MLIRVPSGWWMKEADATPERVYRDRRRLLGEMGFGLGAALALTALDAAAGEGARQAPDPPGSRQPDRAQAASHAGYPARRNAAYALDRELTDETAAARHNIFDEFAAERDKVHLASAGFRTEPWKLHVGGRVKAPLTFDVGELVRRLGLEERLYRHRCVEAWAMAVPWTGFPLARLVELAQPLGDARFVRFVSAARPEEMPGWYASRRVFPYYEALTLAEATNELAFVATGIYGHPLPPQHGAPLRLVLPWKYGFKSAKSIVAMQLTSERPGTFWSDLAPDKYDFFANVDPAVAKPWPQTHERLLGTDERRETQPYNGYAAQVAHLYG